MNTTNAVKVPYRLSHTGRRDAQGRSVVMAKRAGESDAGWTVSEFASPPEALAFMATHPDARMPCWGGLRDKLSAA